MIIGLTGGIGTGKSTAAEYLKTKGFEHIDADAISHELTMDGSPILDVLEKEFPGTVEDGVLNRKALADQAFSSIEKTEKLNSIMHKAIRHIINNRINHIVSATSQEDAKILLDAPLLFESGLSRRCDKTILITADRDLRIKRVCERDGVKPEDVIKRMDRQMGEQEKEEKADFTIYNNDTQMLMFQRLDRVLEKLEK